MGRNNLIQIRKGSDWSSDPVLASGEPGFDIPNNILKIGDGVKTWSELIPIGSGSSVSGGLYNIVEDTTPQLGGNLDLNNYNIVGTGNVSVSGNITANSGTLDVLSFNINNESILTKGQLSWDDAEGTLDIGLTDNTIIHIGEHRYFRIRNQTGSPLYKGQVVYASGVHANGIIEPALYVADGTVREVRFMGVILEDVNHQNNGYAIDFGHLEEMDLDGSATNYAVGDETWSDGDILYVHPTVAGKLTKNEPKHSISVAIILDVGNGNGNGRMFVRPTSYGHLDDHHDVAVSGATNGQFLQYNSATDYWVPSSSGNFTTLQVNGTAVPTGVGTTNYVTKWTGTNGLGAGIIYDNGNNIGIGTSFPLAKLHIINPNTFQNPNVIIHDSSDLVAGVGASIILGGKFNTAGSYGDFAEIKSIKESSANNDASASLAFFTTNIADLNERMRITSSGSVGIGVSTPLARLHVDGNGIFASGLNISNQTASTIASFDSNKNIVSLPTSTYPSLTELSHIKGLTSNAQTQINGKVTSNTSITSATKTKITYDSKGLVTAGSDLTESDIPSLSQSKITNLVTDLSDRTTKTYISSRGENLLTNGTALLGDNTNFSAFTFDGSNANSSPGSFRFIGPGTVYTDEFMPVLAEKRYKMSVDAKTLNGIGRYYMMTVAFDVDNQVIGANHHMYRANTLTTLASELKNGDTVVYLTSAANWDNSGTAGVSTHLRSIILWNYTNSFGYTYPPLTYSRNWLGNAWDPGSIDFVNNTITLRVPWAGGTVPAGTQLSNGSSGGSFKYNILSNTLLTTSWTTYTGFMDGIDYSGTNVTTKFPPGTAKIKLGWLMNYAGTGETAWFTNMTVGLDDNAYTATTLQTSRNINGTSFNGSADITTSSWGTARNVTIGNTTRSVNGSTNYSWTLSDIGAQATLTNPVTGTGTSNFLPKWSTTSNLTNSAISENSNYLLMSKPIFMATDPTDFLGELWISPTGYLFVNPIGTYTNRFLVDTDEVILTQIANRTAYNTAQTPAYSFLTNTDVGMYLPGNSGHLAFSTSGTERLRILSNGNVGIGSQLPSSRLDIVGTGNSTDRSILTIQDPSSGGTTSWIKLYAEDSFGFDPPLTWHIAYGDLTFFRDLEFRTSFSSVPEVTIEPSGDFHVVGDGSVHTPRYKAFDLATSYNTAAKPAFTWVNDDDNGMFLPTSNNIAFSTAGLERLRIDSNGNVGIGTASPSEKLDIRYPGGGGMALIKSTDSNDGLLLGDIYGASTAYQGLSHVDFSDSQSYMIMSEGTNTLISANTGGSVFLRGGPNNNSNEIRIYSSASNGIVINEQGADSDFRVEGDTLSYLLHTDASKDEVVIHNAIGYGLNYATSEGWVQATGTPTTSQVGYYGGNFESNGAAENYVDYSDLPNGLRGLVWQSRDNGTDNSTDGGWYKLISGLDPNKTYISIVYFRRVGSSTTGTFYHGCKGNDTINLNGTTNSNPYFHSWNMTNFPQDVWCVSIGIIHANNDTISANSGFGGIYRLDTGEKIYNFSTDYKMAASATIQAHRTYLYYDAVGDTDADWCWPGFYEVTADSIVNLLNTILYDHFSGRDITINEGGGNFDFRVEGDTDSNLLFTDASTDRVGIGTSSPTQKLEVITNQLEVAGFNFTPSFGPLAPKDLQNFIIESRNDSIILKHLENPLSDGVMELKNLIRYSTDFISIDAAYSGVLGITYYPKLKVNTSTGATTFNDAYTLPTADGSSGQALVTDGNGNVSWEDVSSSSNLTRGSFVLTQTSGTFVVDGGYNVGTLDVYYNGSKLLTGTDYSATNGSSFTLTNPAASGDIVEYLALNAQTSAVGNTVLGSVSVTSSQSVFDVQNGYTAGGLAVFLNGIKLIDTIDFSATNGTSFTLTSPASSGDIVDYIAYGAVVASTNLQKTGDTMTGNLTIGNGSDLIVEGDFILSSYKEGFVDFGNTGSTKTIDISSGTIQTCVLTANCVFTMPNPEAGRSFTLLLKTGTGNFTSTFTNVKWSNDSSPTITTASNKIDILTFVSDGVNWYGTITQNYST